jgi:adenylate cyclase, class 2
MPVNYEFKARTDQLDKLESILLEKDPRFAGEDLQRDTYFHVPNGRLKLREGNIENALIHYEREDSAGSKISKVQLYQHQPDKNLKAILEKALGVKVIVEKKRRIYFIGNVKFHFDRIKGLGEFVEVEAIDSEGSIGAEELAGQCRQYADLFGIRESDYVAVSYSDMMLEHHDHYQQMQ